MSNTHSKQAKIICPYDCPSTCGLLAEVQDGRLVRVTNDPDHPVSCRTICRKMQHYERSVNSEERILYPMKRTGKKGEASFERISWEEAVQTITDKWKEIISTDGSEAIANCMFSGVMSDVQRFCGDAFWNRMGASGLLKTLCSTAKVVGYASVMGKTGALDPHELVDSDVLFIWSCNMSATRIQTLAELSGRKNQKKILIDTYANPSAKFCDETVLIRGGSDGALALAIMHELERTGKTDEEFLHNYTDCWDEWKQQLVTCTPEWAETETGVPADTIRHLAALLADAHAPAILLGSGFSRHRNGGMATRLITLLPAVLGAWAKKGGGLCGCNPLGDRSLIDMSLITRPDFRKKEVRSININQMGDALALTGKNAVKSLYVYGGNPANTLSDQTAIIRGLEREDLFTVVHERFMTDTARYADIILPATFSTEQSDTYRCYGYCTLGVQRKVTEAPGECRSNWDTFASMAKAMGFEDEYFTRTEDEMVDYILDHPTPAVAALPEEQKQVLIVGGSIGLPYADHMKFLTPSGKIQFCDTSLAEDYQMAHYVKDEIGNYPLHLISTPSVYSLNSTFTDRLDLMKERGEQAVLIHPEAAKARGIADGDKVILFNDLAEVEYTAIVTEDVHPDNVVCPGVSQRGNNKNTFNALNHQYISDMGEATTLNGNSVEIRLL